MKQHKPKLKNNSRGRPRLRYKGLAIVMRLPPQRTQSLGSLDQGGRRVALSPASNPQDSQRRAWQSDLEGIDALQRQRRAECDEDVDHIRTGGRLLELRGDVAARVVSLMSFGMMNGSGRAVAQPPSMGAKLLAYCAPAPDAAVAPLEPARCFVACKMSGPSRIIAAARSSATRGAIRAYGTAGIGLA
jgi:hypothetical protein